ncbi:hypothetical protein J437_LFUL004832 [Ladona fulva]|uniref:Reverse transcriptase domain-containing protein n=1 Tax=Ladona fulva TaxID=123851 RepID=A0A8K0NZL4_LADFU|nr:hypothetical protein J437_LFUL004832 [Ladona fulva]
MDAVQRIKDSREVKGEAWPELHRDKGASRSAMALCARLSAMALCAGVCWLPQQDQYGFQKNKGTRDALETLFNDLNENLDKRNHVILSFVDYRKAFETINHDTLLEILNEIGIRGRKN